MRPSGNRIPLPASGPNIPVWRITEIIRFPSSAWNGRCHDRWRPADTSWRVRTFVVMSLFDQLAALSTEGIHPTTREIDLASSREIVEMINREDATVAAAVALELDHVAAAVDHVAAAFRRGGRLIYVGAGTSGRLGIVDASECPPTYGVSPDMVQGIIAGGPGAVFRSVEGAEDSEEEGAEALRAIDLQPSDVVCGIAASGRTPFVVGAVRAAHEAGCRTVFVSTNDRSTVGQFVPFVDVLICPHVGPEVVAGSTRMKSGTAQKMVLNMITTAAMIRIGKTYGNVMVDLQLTNRKLQERARRIVMTIAGVTYEEAESLIREADGHVKTALIMGLLHCSKDEARERLERADGFVRRSLE